MLITCCVGVHMTTVLFLNNVSPTMFSWFQKSKSVVFILNFIFLIFFLFQVL